MSLTSTVFGTPGTTSTQQAPGTKPPGYQFARDFYNSLGQITSNPFPTYQGNLDPGLSPTLQNLLRQAQGYAQSGPPEILAGVQGSLGQFMNPSFANPVARMQFGAPDYFNQNPNQTVYNGGTVNGLAGVFSQSQNGSNMPSMSGQPGQINPSPPIYAGGQQPGQPPGQQQPGNATQGLQNAFLQNAKPLSGFPTPPPGTMQGIGGFGSGDQLGHGGFGHGGFTNGGYPAVPGGGGPGGDPLQIFDGSAGTFQFPWGQTPGGPGGLTSSTGPGQPTGPGSQPWRDPGFSGSLSGQPGNINFPPGAGDMGPMGPMTQHPLNDQRQYGGYSVDQLQHDPSLAGQLGAHAAGLWRAFSGQPGGPMVGPNTRHPLNHQQPLPTKPTRNPGTGGIASHGG